ncbi:MAG: MotA/TolQ/ExbB proton channel family protein [Elainellaceae cyanobacterium]
MNIWDLFIKGGPAMWPLLLLSILALSTIIERVGFWSKILTRERAIVGRTLEAARRDWNAARDIARRSLKQPIGRFLNSGLDLQDPDPEVFQLALQTSADEELAAMRRGDKILETVIALSPLLGLLGTVLGLINSLGAIRIGDIVSGSNVEVTLGISEALISTAFGLIVAIMSLAFYRIFQGLITGQIKVFRRAANELELLYRKSWSRKQRNGNVASAASLPASADYTTAESPSASLPNPSTPNPSI